MSAADGDGRDSAGSNPAVDADALRDLWAVYDAHRKQVQARWMEHALENPRFRAMADVVPPEKIEARSEEAHEMLRRAMLAGEWEAYESYLRAQGRNYEAAGLTFEDWHALVSDVFGYLWTPVLEAHVGEPWRLWAALRAMADLANRVIRTVGAQYLASKEERVRAQERLSQRQARTLRAWGEVFAQSSLGVATVRPETGRIALVNPAFAALHGFVPEEIVGRRLSDLYPPEEFEAADEHLRRAAQMGMGSFEAIHVRSDRSLFLSSTDVHVVRDDQGRPQFLVLYVQDITARERGRLALEQSQLTLAEAERERRTTEERLGRVEEQLRQTQKMEALGRLAGGVAHDFNNLLSVVLGYCEVLREQLSPADPRRSEVLEIERAGERAADLTHKLLAFSRQQVLQPRIVDINEVLAAMEAMLRRLIGEDVRLELRLAGGLPKVRMDVGQLEQVVMNLAVNARDAMPEGGSLSIVTDSVHLERDQAAALAVPAGPYVRLSVADDGSGMDQATRERIFEPFFTTKDKHKGTGLGLSTVQGIIQQSAAGIRVESAIGRGTTFTIVVPVAAVQDEAALPAAPPPPPRAKPGTGETVLLVEDEESVRRMIATILEQGGYRVLAAPDAESALRVVAAQERPPSLVLTDLVMPGMSGRALAERISELAPGLPVLFISGYTDDRTLRYAVTEPGFAFLPKPVTPDALRRKVRALLDERHARASASA